MIIFEVPPQFVQDVLDEMAYDLWMSWPIGLIAAFHYWQYSPYLVDNIWER